MLITLSELKGYLRIDSNDDDALLESLMGSAEKICAGILRTDDISKLESTENAKVAELYAATYLYEHRAEADHNKMNLTLRALLFSDRSDEF